LNKTGNKRQAKPGRKIKAMISSPYYIVPDENGFKGSLLDDFLAAGFYRMLHMVFTTHYTELDTESSSLPVFWLRTQVKKIKENKTALAIRKKCKAFTVEYKKAAITPEIEALYSLYHNHIDFKTADTCQACIHDNRMENPFDSWMIEIRDGDMLIAAGYFDQGKNAITGILNFYHPDYKKYSLGKYLMLTKIDYALSNEIALYYTGYISTATTKFDYKLFPDTSVIEVYLPLERKWEPYELVGKEGLEGYWRNILNEKEGG
jgi:leucyl-tRNA---protein transferase